MSTPVRIVLATSPTPGAVGLIQLHGRGAADLLRRVTGRGDWPAGRLRLGDLAGVDEGFAVLLGEDWAQLMPHGGPRVVRKMIEKLLDLGGVFDAAPPPRDVYPEAASDLEADMLATLAEAASPAAIDLLLAQPRLWRDFLTQAASGHRPSAIESRSVVLDRLVVPSTVVVVGRPNVGKSTLGNRVLGRAASIVADLPGTTRDWVAGLAEFRGVALRWLDTPGVRATDDPIEARAIELASRVIAGADVVVAMRDDAIDWPEVATLPRTPDLWVVNKIDRAAARADDSHDPAYISAATGEGVEKLMQRVLAMLGLLEIREELWAFSERLKELLRDDDRDSLNRYQAQQ